MHKLINTDCCSTESTLILSALDLLPAFFEVVFSVLLTISACYIANNVRISTGKKQNTCLLTWHVFNLLILIIVTVFVAVYDLKQYPDFEDEDEDPDKYHYYEIVA